MAWKHSKWEESKGVRVLRVCGNPNGKHKGKHWPRLAILDLSAEQFEEFREDPLEFTKNRNLFPEQPIRWIYGCASPPEGEGIPKAAKDSRKTVLICHGRPSISSFTVCSQQFDKR